MYSKNYIDSQDELGEMRRKLKIMNHQIDQLKEEIQGKEQELQRAQTEHDKVKKEKEQAGITIEQLKKEATKKEEAYSNQQAEFERLNKQLSEANDERKRQMKQLQQVCAFPKHHRSFETFCHALGYCRTRCSRYTTRSTK